MRGARKQPALAVATLAAVLLVIAALWAMGVISFGKAAAPENRAALAPQPAAAPVPAATPAAAMAPLPSAYREIQTAAATAAAKPVSEQMQNGGAALPALLRQRLDSTQALFATLRPGSASIQLFYTEDAHPARVARLENFLERADKLGTLGKIQVVPSESNSHGGYRVLYGVFPSIEAANAAMLQLPPAYRESYAPTLYIPNTRLPTP